MVYYQPVRQGVPHKHERGTSATGVTNLILADTETHTTGQGVGGSRYSLLVSLTLVKSRDHGSDRPW